MTEQKSRPTEQSVQEFLEAIPELQRREDAYILLQMMSEITGESPRMWGTNMIGFGEYHYKYATGHEGDSFVTGFAPRKGAFSLYFTCDLAGRFPEELKALGKYKHGKGCLYVKRLSDVDLVILRKMIATAVAELAGYSVVKVTSIETNRRK